LHDKQSSSCKKKEGQNSFDYAAHRLRSPNANPIMVNPATRFVNQFDAVAGRGFSRSTGGGSGAGVGATTTTSSTITSSGWGGSGMDTSGTGASGSST
jgi:hypothetical protein